MERIPKQTLSLEAVRVCLYCLVVAVVLVVYVEICRVFSSFSLGETRNMLVASRTSAKYKGNQHQLTTNTLRLNGLFVVLCFSVGGYCCAHVGF